MTIAEWIARNLATAPPLGGGCLLCPEFNFHRNCCSVAIFIKTLKLLTSGVVMFVCPVV